jgi:hypothetical protein
LARARLTASHAFSIDPTSPFGSAVLLSVAEQQAADGAFSPGFLLECGDGGQQAGNALLGLVGRNEAEIPCRREVLDVLADVAGEDPRIGRCHATGVQACTVGRQSTALRVQRLGRLP